MCLKSEKNYMYMMSVSLFVLAQYTSSLGWGRLWKGTRIDLSVMSAWCHDVPFVSVTNTGCPADLSSENTVQCLNIQFAISVNEGFDSLITVTSDTEMTLLVILSDTPNTRQLKGYNVSIQLDCTRDLKSIDIWRRYEQISTEKCTTQLVSPIQG